MRKLIKLVLLINLIVCASNAMAQKSTIKRDTIELDFSDPKSKLPDTSQMAYNKKYVIKLSNVNLNLFKVEGTVSQTDYNTDMPEIFKGVKLPGYLNTALPTAKEESVENASASARTAGGKDIKTEIELRLKIIATVLEKIKETVLLSNEYKNLYASCDLKFTQILNRKQLLTNTYLSANHSKEEDIITDLRKTLVDQIARAIQAKKEIDELKPLLFEEVNGVIKKNKMLIKEYDAKIAKGQNLLPSEVLKYKAAEETLEVAEKLKTDIDEQIREAITFVEELKKFRDDNKVEDLVNNYKMLNESNFTYYSEPSKVKKDEVKVEVKVTSDKLLPCNIPTKKTYENTYNTKGGVKVDFSSGVFANGGNDDFLGRELQYKAINDSIVQIESKDGGKRLLISVGALMHIYWRSGNKVNFAISPGLSTTTAFDGINFHLGGSAIFGGQNRLVLSAGLVLREAKILDRNYVYNKDYEKKKMPEAPPTIKVFPKAGWFFGITYNWSKLKK